ncbi:tryptophan 2,3-dioxygenase family protein [Acuticoccus kandeliae]|uniref:tryptophan 2,3-dioxygenase family protein n=1 Tax=Acuticoccus kandeliae TaxID=2073160 RepID=UPI000D3ED129|nr:tryptophan 2,3-dioxygenase family protein [Acuticoccus kandeliae]
MRRGVKPAGPGEITYSSYLALDEILGAQRPESARLGVDAHDELLFIIVHQTYELWFKQILHELDRVQADFAESPVDDWRLGRMVHALRRITQILKLGVQQIDVLETMTPQDFLDFRGLLSTSSGFQSLQFRLVETRLGLGSARRLLYEGKTVDADMSEAERTAYHAAEAAPTLRDQLEAWLVRTPFVTGERYAFRSAYREAVMAMLRRERDFADNVDQVDEAAAIERAAKAFEAIFEPDPKAGWTMSGKAVEAALFITVYRDKPALHMPASLLSSLMDIDEAMALWRTRHALMVERMIGMRSGTGGSSGHEYLARTAREHRVFADLFRLSTYLIPRDSLPPIPPEIERRMGFVYATPESA